MPWARREWIDGRKRSDRRATKFSMRVSIQPLHPELGKSVALPERKSSEAAGLDLCAVEAVNLSPGQRALVPCGFAMALPRGFEAQIRPRSGLALKHGVTVLNSPGTIDSDYRGEVKVLLVNHGEAAFEIEVGMRIAQMVIAEVAMAGVEVVAELPKSDRGGGGFGSTGTG